MAAATASSTGVRYAPEDPTLPKPWRGLVDGKTGYLYFWNPETNTTQYERPVDSLHASNVPSQKSLSLTAQKSFQGHHGGNGNDNDNEDRNSQGGNGGSTKVASDTETYQTARSSSDCSQKDSGAKISAGHVPYASKGAECSLSGESYRQRHEITVTGANVPQPFISFQSSGFPSEILREVRYLLHGGAKCRTLCFPLVEACMYLEVPLLMDKFLRRAF